MTRRSLLQSGLFLAGGMALAACGNGTPGANGGQAENESAGDPMLAVSDGKLSFATCLPLSGAFTIVTQPWVAAIKYAIEERNEAGGLRIGGTTVEVEAPVFDEEYTAQGALNSMQRFTSQGGHYAGGFVSEEGPLAVLGTNERADLALVLGITGEPALNMNSLRFYEYALAQATGAAKADFAYHDLGLRRMATIELRNSWGKDYQEAFAVAFEALGGEIVSRDFMVITDTDYTGVLSSWRPLEPDGIYIIIGDGPGATIGTQATELGFDSQPILTEGAWDPNSYIEAGTSFIDRAYYAAQYPYCHWGPRNSEFAERLYDETQLYITNWFWHGYDSTRMMLDAMELADSSDPRDVLQALPEAVANGEWEIQAPGAIATEQKGVYLQTPLWISKFKHPDDVDFLTESPLEPVEAEQYLEIPGWMPEGWEGYEQPYAEIQHLTGDELNQLRG